MIIIFDIDGTLADNSHRQHFLDQEPPDWKNFNYNMPYDIPRWEIVAKLFRWAKYARIILVTGRGEENRKETEEWLKEHKIPYEQLLMRPAADPRPDDIVKKELFNSLRDNDQVMLIYDDRPSVIRMWESMGLDVVDVGDGVEF